MTSKRNLGPILAIAGGAIAIAAVITGFILVGGPGDARDRRLDEKTLGRVTDVLNITQCAFDETGVAPATIDEARKVNRTSLGPGEVVSCSLGTTTENVPVSAGGNPASPGDVSYDAVAPNRIRICANFRRPSDAETCNGICSREYGSAYPQIHEPHPAGVHCYDIELVKGMNGSALNTHAGHMDTFE